MQEIKCQIDVVFEDEDYLFVTDIGYEKGLPSVFADINPLLERLVATNMLGDRRLIVLSEDGLCEVLVSGDSYRGKKSLDMKTVERLHDALAAKQTA